MAPIVELAYRESSMHGKNVTTIIGETINNETVDELIGGSQPPTFYSTPSLVCGIVMIAIAFIGIVGNAITAIVFTYKRTAWSKATTTTTGASAASYCSSSAGGQLPPTPHSSGKQQLSSIAILVSGLACMDAILLSLSCPLFASSAFYAYNPTLPLLNAVSYMTVYVYPLASVFQTASVWTLSIITIERYFAVKFPFVARVVFTPSRAMWALGGTALVSVAYNAPRFWEYCVYRIEAADDPNVVLIVALPTLRADPNYMRIYGHWMYFGFIFALPFAILVVFNGSVIRVVRLARFDRRALTRQQTKEQGTALMMGSVAVVFLSCNLLAFVLNALEVFGGSGATPVQLPSETSADNDTNTVRHSSTFYLLIDFNNLLVMTHCSANFFVYYYFSECFRNGFYRLLRCWSGYLCCVYGASAISNAFSSSSSVDTPAMSHGGSANNSRKKHTAVMLLRRFSSRGSYRGWRNGTSGTARTIVPPSSANGWRNGDSPISAAPYYSRIMRTAIIGGVRSSV